MDNLIALLRKMRQDQVDSVTPSIGAIIRIDKALESIDWETKTNES